MWLNGRDLRSEPLTKRKERLRKLMLRANNPALLYADHVDQYGIDFFRMIWEKNLEGMAAKHRAMTCYDVRAKGIKIKNREYTHIERRHELYEKSKRG